MVDILVLNLLLAVNLILRKLVLDSVEPILFQSARLILANVGCFIMYLLSTVFISEIVVSNLYAFLLKKYSATFIAFSGFLYPIFSALLGWIFLKEQVTYNFFISTVIVSAALYMFHLSEIEKRKRQPEGFQ